MLTAVTVPSIGAVSVASEIWLAQVVDCSAAPGGGR